MVSKICPQNYCNREWERNKNFWMGNRCFREGVSEVFKAISAGFDKIYRRTRNKRSVFSPYFRWAIWRNDSALSRIAGTDTQLYRYSSNGCTIAFWLLPKGRSSFTRWRNGLCKGVYCSAQSVFGLLQQCAMWEKSFQQIFFNAFAEKSHYRFSIVWNRRKRFFALGL